MKKIFILLLLIMPMAAMAQSPEWCLMRKGNRAYHSGDLAEAMRCYTDAKAANNTSARADYNLGLVYIKKKDFSGASKQFDTVLKSEKNNRIKSMAYFNRGYISQTQASDSLKQQNIGGQQQKLREAIEEYKNALRLNPNDDEARYNLALCQKQLKNDQSQSQQQKDDKQKKDKDQQNKDKDKEKNKDKNKDDQQQSGASDQNKKDKKQEPDLQTQQLLNLTRQAEQRTLQAVNESNRQSRRSQQRSGGKNW